MHSYSMQNDQGLVLSIVIVNTDGTEDTLNCLESICQAPPSAKFELILIDNCSSKPVIPQVQARYPLVRTFNSPERQGFARNYNQGIQEARGEYVMILNNDIIVQSGAFDALLNCMQETPSYGMVGPKLVSLNGQIQSTCARSFVTPGRYVLLQLFLDPGFPMGRLWERFKSWKLSQKKTGVVQCISGACMMTTSEVINSVGMLDEDYDFYFEDIEWCHRFFNHGMQVVYIAEAEITHLGDRSLRKVREWGKRSEFLSALRYFREYHGLTMSMARLIWFSSLVGYIIRAAAFWIKGVFSKEQGYAPEYWRLTKWIINQYPHE